MNYPRITVVTPSFNMGNHLEATIRSVLDQNYPNLEYIIVDGGSTDESVNIIQQYADRLTKWVSEPDGGQYDAINKGFTHATGDILAWLNADDIYFPWTLNAVARWFTQFETVDWVSGEVCYINHDGQVIETHLTTGGLSRELAARGCYRSELAGYLPQEGMFWRHTLWEKSGAYLDKALTLAADFELWTRFASYATPVAAKCLLAGFRKHPRVQRSEKQRAVYRQQVLQASAKLPSPPFMWTFAGYWNATNLLYRWLFLHGASETIDYNLIEDMWQHHRRPSGSLYRPLVVRRKL